MRQSLRLTLVLVALLVPTIFFAQEAVAGETAASEEMRHTVCDPALTLETQDAHICLSRFNGAFRWVRLVHPQYHQKITPIEEREDVTPKERFEEGPLDLVTTWDPPFYPFQVRDWVLSPDPEVRRILRQEATATFKRVIDVETQWYVKFSKSEGNLEKWIPTRTGVEVLFTPDEALNGLESAPGPNTEDPTDSGVEPEPEPEGTASTSISGKERVLARVIKRQRAGSPWFLVKLENPDVATPKQGQGLKVRLQATGDFSKVYALDPRFTILPGTEEGFIRLVWPNPETDRSDLFVERHFRVGKTRFTLEHVLRFFWNGDGALKHRETLKLFGRAGLKQEEASMLNPFPEVIEPICSADEDVESWDGEEVGDIDSYPNADWVGLGRRYFLLGIASTTTRGAPQCVMRIKPSSLFEANLVPAVDKVLNDGASNCTPDYRTKDNESSCQDLMKALGLNDFTSRRQAEIQATHGGEGMVSDEQKLQVINLVNQDERAIVFTGPKDLKSLEAAGSNLDTALDFGIFSPLSRPLLWLLQFYHGIFGHWAWGIFFLTITVKLLLLYWTMKAYVSMRNMQRLKPEMEKIKEKHKENKTEMNQAMMGLYKRHKVNPLGGCLPMLIQMPVYFALYRTIYATPDLYQAPLFGWIQDLSKPDPLFIMPIALGVLMFVQQRISMGLSDGAGANKFLLYFMPFMFTGLMLFLPSGLVFYILINTTLSLIQQKYIYSKNPKPNTQKTAKT
jgi:YidC/Oxa1 family membrane protein insertase